MATEVLIKIEWTSGPNAGKVEPKKLTFSNVMYTSEIQDLLAFIHSIGSKWTMEDGSSYKVVGH